MLAIEIDGESHDQKSQADQKRQKKLESLGVRFLRFYDEDVKQNNEAALTMIDRWIVNNSEPVDKC